MRKILRALEDVIQIYFPMGCFVVLFVVFNMQVLLRYVFKAPTMWSSELSGIMFLWLVMCATNYTTKHHKHVCFSMVYDGTGERGKKAIRIMGSLLLIITYSLGLIPCARAILGEQKLSTVLRLPLCVVYFPFVIFLVFTIGYSIDDLVRELRPGRKEEGEQV